VFCSLWGEGETTEFGRANSFRIWEKISTIADGIKALQAAKFKIYLRNALGEAELNIGGNCVSLAFSLGKRPYR
jgi:hypothetical protein